jgi:hypothetical protein
MWATEIDQRFRSRGIDRKLGRINESLGTGQLMPGRRSGMICWIIPAKQR